MPTKFVQNSAERAGISVEAAEKKWHEAKQAVHKGKRRGSWYWGKVVNTFKRMMGLSESMTFKDFMLLESDQGQNKNDHAERAMIHKIVELACNNGLMKGGKTEANLEKAYDFLESDWGGKLWDKHYELFSTMDPKFNGPFDRKRYASFKQEAVAWFRKWKNGATFKDTPIEKMHEEETPEYQQVRLKWSKAPGITGFYRVAAKVFDPASFNILDKSRFIDIADVDHSHVDISFTGGLNMQALKDAGWTPVFVYLDK